MGSDNLISFAIEQGWYDPDSGEPFHLGQVYGQSTEKSSAVNLIEQRLRDRAGRITVADMFELVRTTDVTGDTAGYGQVAHLRNGLHPELGTLWVAATTSVTAPFIPYRIGVQDVPSEFQRHRYLTEGEAAQFQNEAERGLESTRSAFQVFKRLYYLTEEHRQKFLPEVTEALEALETRLIADQDEVERMALVLHEADKPDLARKYLTYYSQTEAMHGLDLGENRRPASRHGPSCCTVSVGRNRAAEPLARRDPNMSSGGAGALGVVPRWACRSELRREADAVLLSAALVQGRRSR